MSIIVCNCQHCDEQQFQTLSCVHYTIFLIVKLDLFLRALLYWIAFLLRKKLRVRLAYILLINTIKNAKTGKACGVDGFAAEH